MDAGFLHHLSHEQGFEDSDAMYFFDEDNMKLCQPFAMLEADITECSASSENEVRSVESVTLSSRHKMSIGASPKGILSQLTASLSSSSRSVSKTSIFSSTSDVTSASSDGSDSNRCPCSRLAQRLEPASRQTRRRHRRNHKPRRKCAPILEEDNTLERNLLDELDDDEFGGTPSSSRGNRSGSGSINGLNSSTGDSQHRHASITIAAA